MDSRRIKPAFASLALIALLAWAAPAVRAQPAAGPITDAQFQKITAMMHGSHAVRGSRGKPTDLLPSVAAALGLSDGKGAVLGRIAITDKQGTRYQMSVLSGGRGYLLSRHSGTSTRFFLMDANRAFVSGATAEGTQYPSTMAADDAKSLFAQDLSAWARIADAYPPAKTR